MHIAGILMLWFCWIQVQMLGIDLNFTCTSTWMIDLYSPKPNPWSRSCLLPFNPVWKLSSWLLMFRLVCTGWSSCQYATLLRKLKLFAYNFKSLSLWSKQAHMSLCKHHPTFCNRISTGWKWRIVNFEDKGGCSFNSSKSKMHIKDAKKIPLKQSTCYQARKGWRLNASSCTWLETAVRNLPPSAL